MDFLIFGFEVKLAVKNEIIGYSETNTQEIRKLIMQTDKVSQKSIDDKIQSGPCATYHAVDEKSTIFGKQLLNNRCHCHIFTFKATFMGMSLVASRD